MGEIRTFIKKTVYIMGANLMSLFVSFLTTLLIPKFFGEEITQFGYLQIYLFYVNYIGFFHFGWCDGIYLRDGGKDYQSLDKPLYSAQFWLLLLLQFGIGMLISASGLFLTESRDYAFICFAVALSLVIYLPRTMLAYYMQTTNRMKEFAAVTTAGRMVYGFAIVVIILAFPRDYRYFVWGDLLSRLVELLVTVWWCRDIVFSKPAPLGESIKEAAVNISIGIKLMFANISGMLVTGIVRWGVQVQWDVATYGKISLTLSVSNLLLAFISAVALVLYPTLRRSNEEILKPIYGRLQDALIIPLMGCLILYYPIEQILSAWLPQYADSLRYMAILFPVCIYAAKKSMLIQTYMNVLRLEKDLLKANVVGLIFTAVSTLISVFVLESLGLAMLGMVMTQMLLCVYSESMLSKYIPIAFVRESILEAVLVLLFIVSSWSIGGWVGVCIYTIGYIVFLIVKKDSAIALLRQIKQIFVHRKDAKE